MGLTVNGTASAVKFSSRQSRVKWVWVPFQENFILLAEQADGPHIYVAIFLPDFDGGRGRRSSIDGSGSKLLSECGSD